MRQLCTTIVDLPFPPPLIMGSSSIQCSVRGRKTGGGVTMPSTSKTKTRLPTDQNPDHLTSKKHEAKEKEMRGKDSDTLGFGPATVMHPTFLRRAVQCVITFCMTMHPTAPVHAHERNMHDLFASSFLPCYVLYVLMYSYTLTEQEKSEKQDV